MSGTLNDAEFIPGTINAPTVHPAAAELPGHTKYLVDGRTVIMDPRPLTFVRFGLPCPPACSAGVPSVYPGRLWRAALTWTPHGIS